MSGPRQPLVLAPSPPCELDNPFRPHEPGKLLVTAFPPQSDTPIYVRVCRHCLYSVTKVMRKDKYQGITVTAPESAHLYTPHRN
jgi:hypothetical protein